MNRETIASLYDVKQAALQQQTLAMREIGQRLAASEAERDALLAQAANPYDDGSITTAMAASRYRAYQQKALTEVSEAIDAIMVEFRDSETELSAAFAEVRAIERLMQR